jgi:predicted Co/Zn/Cd cation transporter (cation efflux family)
MALIVILLVTQVWLLSATLNSYLAGHRDVVIPGAVVSGLLFLMCAALYLFIVRLARRTAKNRS